MSRTPGKTACAANTLTKNSCTSSLAMQSASPNRAAVFAQLPKTNRNNRAVAQLPGQPCIFIFNPPVLLCAAQRRQRAKSQKQRSWGREGSVVHPCDLVEVRQASYCELSSGKEDYGKSNSKEKSWLADN